MKLVIEPKRHTGRVNWYVTFWPDQPNGKIHLFRTKQAAVQWATAEGARMVGWWNPKESSPELAIGSDHGGFVDHRNNGDAR